MKSFWLVATSLALMVAGAAPVQAQSRTSESPSNVARQDIFLLGLRFPEYVAGRPRGRLVDYESGRAGLGYSMGYDQRDERVTVYVYDLGASSIPTELGSNAVRRQFTRAQADIAANVGPDPGRFTRVTPVSTYSIADDEGTARYLCASYEIEQNDQQFDSYLCLTSWNDRFVKYRITRPKAAGNINEASRFVQQWTETLWPKEQRAHADALRGQRFLTLLYQAEIARKRCEFAMTPQQEAKLTETKRVLQMRAKLTAEQAGAIYGEVERRFDAAEKAACDQKSPFAIDYKAVVETMLSQ